MQKDCVICKYDKIVGLFSYHIVIFHVHRCQTLRTLQSMTNQQLKKS